VKTPAARREQLLDEFERSGLSGRSLRPWRRQIPDLCALGAAAAAGLLGTNIQCRFQALDGLLFILHGNRGIMRHFFVTVFRRCATLCCLAPSLLLCGCTVFLMTSILFNHCSGGGSFAFYFKADLTTSTRYVEFVGLHGQPGSSQTLRITIVNRGRSAFLAKQADGKYASMAPNASADLFDEEIETSTNSLRFPVTGIEHRTPCDFVWTFPARPSSTMRSKFICSTRLLQCEQPR